MKQTAKYSLLIILLCLCWIGPVLAQEDDPCAGVDDSQRSLPEVRPAAAVNLDDDEEEDSIER